MSFIKTLPASKFVFLAIKQFARYVANFMKEKAKEKPLFRKYICMPPAQWYHWCEVKTQSVAMNLGHPVVVKPLNERDAIELGSHLLGEFVLFAITAGAIVLEITRQSKKETKKKLAEKQYNLVLTKKLGELNAIMDKQYVKIMNMKEALKNLGQPAHEIYFVEPPEPPPTLRQKKIKATQATIVMKAKQIQTDAIKS